MLMFRFYELYSLYLQNMSRYGRSPIWCLCEKLPRSILHIEPTQELWCEVCGRRRRPRAALSSSSDEDEKAASKRQLMLAEQRRAAQAQQVLVRVKVAMSAQKPNLKGRGKCIKCDPKHKVSVSMLPCSHASKPRSHDKLCIGRFRHFRKPQRLQAKHNENDATLESQEQVGSEPMDAPPPSPSSPPIVSEHVPKATDSLWEQPNENMPSLVAFAHEVFNRPLHLRKCQPTYYDTLFVSDFIPLDKPITDAAGGAISKRRKIFGRPIRPHRSRSLPPLSQVLSELRAKQNVRAEGGGLMPKEPDFNGNCTASQFPPFDCYDGPSEDALVVDSARHMLRQPNALHISQREDLPSTRLQSFESEPSSDFSSSSPFDMPSAPPVERQHHSYVGVGAPLRMHDVMKAVAQSGLSDSSASSSSSSDSSHKSISSTQPMHQQSLRSCGGEEYQYVEKPVKAEPLPYSVMEKIIWLMDQKPDPSITEEGTKNDIPMQENQDSLIENCRSESVQGMLQFMETLHIAEGGDTDNTLKLHKNTEDELKASAEHTKLEPNLSNDMSNELNLNSVNKSAGDATYVKVLSNCQHNGRLCHRSCKARKPRTPSSGSNTTMWSAISGFFSSKLTDSQRVSPIRTVASNDKHELEPLRSTENLHYGTIRTPSTKASSPEIKQELQHRKGSQCSNHSAQPSKPSCRKCKLHSNSNITGRSKLQANQVSSINQIQQRKEHKSSCKLHAHRASKVTEDSVDSASSAELSPSSSYQSTKTYRTEPKEQIEPNSECSINAVQLQVKLGKMLGLEKMQLQNIFNVLRRVSKPPLTFYPVRIVELIRHECIVIDQSKAIAYSTNISSSGELQNDKDTDTDTDEITADASMGFLEFRTPDVEEVVSKEAQSYDLCHIYETEMGKAHLKSSQQTTKSTTIMKTQENPKQIKRIPIGWPSFARKHKKQQIKYKAVQMELSYTLDESEEKKLKKPGKRREKTMQIEPKWFPNKSVQKKIDEMMTKPIKLLNKEYQLEN